VKYCLLLLAVIVGFPTPFEQGGKWGYRDAAGKVVIPPRFETAGEFSPEGLAAVVDRQGWAYVDPAGKVVIRPFVIDNGPDYFAEGLARFRAAGKIGYFDRGGKVVIPAKFCFALPFSEDRAAVCEGCTEFREDEHSSVRSSRWGYIDKRGALVIPLQFEQAGSFENGRAKVRSNGTWREIDRQGVFLAAASIGMASMEPDGTLVLQLRAEGPGVGDALLRYTKNDPHYQEVLKHIGGLRPGESKPVPPWPEK